MADRRQIHKRQVHKALVLAGLLAATLTAGAAFLSVAPADQSEATAVLGAEWQCRNMMLFTSCTRARHIEPAAQHMGKELGKELGKDMARVRRV